METETLNTFIAGFDKGFIAGCFFGVLVASVVALLVKLSDR